MVQRILILTEAEDVHAIAVAEALLRRGVEAVVWPTSDFPTQAEETVHFNGRRKRIRVRSADLSFQASAFDTIWRRRPAYVLDRDLLHPADRAFAEAECGMFRRSILSILAPEAFWVNSPEGAARAGSKMVQHQAAANVGLRMPETLYTNSLREVRAFFKRRRGRVVYKPFLPTVWKRGVKRWVPYTATLATPNLLNDSLRLTPGIFQELIDKSYEIRLTMIGRQAFAAKIHSQETADGRLDWRKAYGQLQWEPYQIPQSLQEACFLLMEQLGIVFGCFDFVVTPKGEHIFLEVNEMGQFLFIERYCGLPLLDAFVCFLLEGRVDFRWNPNEVRIRYSDAAFESEVLRKSKEYAKLHVATPLRFVEEAPESF